MLVCVDFRPRALEKAQNQSFQPGLVVELGPFWCMTPPGWPPVSTTGCGSSHVSLISGEVRLWDVVVGSMPSEPMPARRQLFFSWQIGGIYIQLATCLYTTSTRTHTKSAEGSAYFRQCVVWHSKLSYTYPPPPMVATPPLPHTCLVCHWLME